LSLYTSSEFDFVTLPEAFTTGSSFMPNKKNPDVVELMRAAQSQVLGAMSEIQNLLSLPSGYHRDLQNTKGPLLAGVRKGLQTLSLLPRLVAEMEFNPESMARAIGTDMYAADKAIELSKQGLPFRDAYKQAMNEDYSNVDPKQSLEARVSPGSPGNLQLNVLEERLAILSP
ncbi:MAG: lyase family protein, partial [Pseudomonadota bacterium]